MRYDFEECIERWLRWSSNDSGTGYSSTNVIAAMRVKSGNSGANYYTDFGQYEEAVDHVIARVCHGRQMHYRVFVAEHAYRLPQKPKARLLGLTYSTYRRYLHKIVPEIRLALHEAGLCEVTSAERFHTASS